MTVSLDVMHSRPGIYLVVSPAAMVFVETDAAGHCHQLKPDTFERDGEMIPGRWNIPAICGIFGPLVRPQK